MGGQPKVDNSDSDLVNCTFLSVANADCDLPTIISNAKRGPDNGNYHLLDEVALGSTPVDPCASGG